MKQYGSVSAISEKKHPVLEALDALEGVLNDQKTAALNLGERLRPILPATPPVPRAEEQEAPDQSSLAGTIRQLVDRARGTELLLRDYIERLEI